MTINQAATLQMNWKRRADRALCEHSNLELEWNERGHSTGHDASILCGETMALSPSRVTIPQVPPQLTVRFLPPDC